MPLAIKMQIDIEKACRFEYNGKNIDIIITNVYCFCEGNEYCGKTKSLWWINSGVGGMR